MTLDRAGRSLLWRLPLLCTALALCAACTHPVTRGIASPATAAPAIEPQREAQAIKVAQAMRAQGKRVWCVPFARNVTGIDIRGNANTWWSQSRDEYAQSHQPVAGSIMAFSGTRRMPMGHVAVVSKVVSPREVLVDHANWHRNQVSLGMAVVDVSKANDWSSVRVESQPGALGSVYPVDGFILPKTVMAFAD